MSAADSGVGRAAVGSGLLDRLHGQANEATVVLRSIALDAIEPDPNQPRMHFDERELQELADSLQQEGLLQEPAVYPVATDGLRPTRYRLLFGERRWRAARLAGWSQIRCKVLPSVDDADLVAQMKRIDQQEKENSARAALTAVEEGKALKQRLLVLQKMEPALSKTSLVEKLATERGLQETSVFRLLDLLEAPPALQRAILEREITSRDIAFQLASHWKAMRRRAPGATVKRELQFREDVVRWAESQGRDPDDADTLTAYAAAHFLDPKLVRATVRTAAKLEGEVEVEFTKLVHRAKGWTVKDARRHLSGSRGARKRADGPKELYQLSNSDGVMRLVVYVDRLADPDSATPAARAALGETLRELLTKVEGSSATATSQ